jgi:hypothetical protein
MRRTAKFLTSCAVELRLDGAGTATPTVMYHLPFPPSYESKKGAAAAEQVGGALPVHILIWRILVEQGRHQDRRTFDHRGVDHSVPFSLTRSGARSADAAIPEGGEPAAAEVPTRLSGGTGPRRRADRRRAPARATKLSPGLGGLGEGSLLLRNPACDC